MRFISVSHADLRIDNQQPKQSILSCHWAISNTKPAIYSPYYSAFIVKGLGWQLPVALQTPIDLLAAVASPAALITIGIFIAEHKPILQRQSAWLIVIKLIATPLLAWFLAVTILNLPLLLAQSAVLLSALPTGTGPYMLAHSYHRSALNTSQTILWSTLFSIASLSIILWLMTL